MPAYELNLTDYWRIINRKKYVILFTLVIVSFFTYLYTQFQQPVYVAAASVRISEQEMINLTGFFSYNIGDTIESKAKVITSQPVVAKMAERLGFIQESQSEEERVAIITSLQCVIRAEPVLNTNLVTISVSYPDARKAAQIANETAEVFIEQSYRERNQQAIAVREFIEGRVNDIKAKLTENEEKLNSFREKGVTGIAITLEDSIKKLESEKIELLRRYTEKHPDVRSIQSQIVMLNDRLASLPPRELEYSRCLRDQEVLDKSYKMLQERYEDARIKEAENTQNVRIVNYATVPTVPASPRKSLNYLIGVVLGLMLGVVFAFIWENFDTSIGTIEDIEHLTKLTVLGVIPFLEERDVALRQLLSLRKLKKIDNWELVRRYSRRLLRLLFQRITGQTPQMSKEERERRFKRLLITYVNPRSPLSESFRILRTNVQFEPDVSEAKKRVPRVYVCTSSGPEEGKSTVVANLAVAMAQNENRTVIVDADLRRPILHRFFGLERIPGLTDVLLGVYSIEEVLKEINEEAIQQAIPDRIPRERTMGIGNIHNLKIITSGSPVSNPSELLNKEKFVEFLKQLKQSFEYILIDAPPILPVTDTLLIGPRVDKALIVYRARKVARSALLRAKEQLEVSRTGIKGVILNHATPEVEMAASYYSFKYYGEPRAHS